MEGPMAKIVFGRVLVLAGVVGCSSVPDETISLGAARASDDGAEGDAGEEIVSVLQQPLTGSQEVCTVLSNSDSVFRETLNVDESWNKQDCKNYCLQVGAHFYAVGCLFDTSFSFSSFAISCASFNEPPDPPSNCGW
jgi:hypothetical protein